MSSKVKPAQITATTNKGTTTRAVMCSFFMGCPRGTFTGIFRDKNGTRLAVLELVSAHEVHSKRLSNVATFIWFETK